MASNLTLGLVPTICPNNPVTGNQAAESSGRTWNCSSNSSANPQSRAGPTAAMERAFSYNQAADLGLCCPICTTLMATAVQIQPCGHSFCAPCLSQHLSAQLQGGVPLMCPFRCGCIVGVSGQSGRHSFYLLPFLLLIIGVDGVLRPPYDSSCSRTTAQMSRGRTHCGGSQHKVNREQAAQTAV